MAVIRWDFSRVAIVLFVWLIYAGAWFSFLALKRRLEREVLLMVNPWYVVLVYIVSVTMLYWGEIDALYRIPLLCALGMAFLGSIFDKAATKALRKKCKGEARGQG